jgi:amidase
VFAHKPSFGLVSTAGHVPPSPARLTVPDLCVLGPMARGVDDLELALEVMVGPHPWDERAWRVELPPARPVRRAATWFDDPYCPVDREIVALLESAAQRLAAAGVDVEPARPGGIRLDVSDEVFHRLLAPVAAPRYSSAELAEIAAGIKSAGGELGADYVHQSIRDLWEAENKRAQLRRRWREFFGQYDVLLLPVAPNLTGLHDHRPFPERTSLVNGELRPYWDQIVWAGLTGVSYLPSSVVPVGVDSRGMPVGMAVAGPYLGDRTTLALARTLSQILPDAGHPPFAAPGQPWTRRA